MANDRSEELQDHHNQGEKDAADYKYDPPRDSVDTTLTHDWVKKEYQEDNDAYNEGYRNGRKQRGD